MEAWKKAQALKEEEQEKDVFNKSKLDQARMKAQMEESAGSSSMSTGQKNKKPEDSYSSDPFEDVSVSGSGSNDKINNIWTKNKEKKEEKLIIARKITESSDKYDDDEFDSMSKSKSDTILDSKKELGKSPTQKTVIAKLAIPT